MKAVILQKLESLDFINEWSGRLIAWLTLVMVLVTFTIVVLRYGFNLGWIAMQESITYMHALIFLVGIPYTLKHDAHVRVDIFYNKMSEHNRAWVNLLGTILLLFPVVIFILYSSWDYVLASWSMLEESGEPGGLPYVYLLKSSILLMTVLLILQGLSGIARNIRILFFSSSP